MAISPEHLRDFAKKHASESSDEVTLRAASDTHGLSEHRSGWAVVDDEPPTISQLFAAVGQPAPDGSQAERASAFSALMDGARIRQDLGFSPV
ncbi:hypothetical protein [uncultured Stenotrophomonas sp.]|uniref:hypothetical protein n=1 Tax=uncultured Stenotrophomonas sp. TaxID=165438 RepID=UPI0028ECDEE7|nr:hypothetical protein [uncultured Stenotrophomonas sp.]